MDKRRRNKIITVLIVAPATLLVWAVIFFIVYEAIINPDGQSDREVEIYTYTQLGDIYNDAIRRHAIIYSPLEPAGHVQAILTSRHGAHFYIATLEDGAPVFIKVDFRVGENFFVPTREFTNTRVRGTVQRMQRDSDMVRMRREFVQSWEITYEEFEEIFTPYFIVARPLDVRLIYNDELLNPWIASTWERIR